jgi:hypothetical protein
VATLPYCSDPDGPVSFQVDLFLVESAVLPSLSSMLLRVGLATVASAEFQPKSSAIDQARMMGLKYLQ